MSILITFGIILCVLESINAKIYHRIYFTANESNPVGAKSGPGVFINSATEELLRIPTFQPILEKLHMEYCSCVNVLPARFSKWSIDNPGNEIMAYFEPNCLQKYWRPIPIGSEPIESFKNETNNVGDMLKTYIENKLKYVRSLGPNPNSEKFKLHCIFQPNREIMRFELLETERKLPQLINRKKSSIDTVPKNRQLPPQVDQQIHFFGNLNFEDFLLARDVTPNCTNIRPSNDKYEIKSGIKSVMTSECVMVFSEPDCLGRSTKIQSPGTTDLTTNWESTVTSAATLALLYKSFPAWTWATKSFRSCNSNKENDLVVDITEYHAKLNTNIDPEVIQTLENICVCKEIPMYVRDLDRWSINNHDKSIYAYFENRCSSKTFIPLWIPAGHSSYSIALGAFHQFKDSNDTMHKILSIGPDYDSPYYKTNCIKLYSTITKIEIIGQNHTEQNVELTAAKTTFRNDGRGTISRTFTASKNVKDSFSVQIGASLSNMERIELDKSFEVETKTATNRSETELINSSVQAGISASATVPVKRLDLELTGSIAGDVNYAYSNTSAISQEDIVKEGLRQVYQNGVIIGNSKKTFSTVEITKSLAVSEVITIPDCYEKVVHAYARTVNDMHIEFRALAKIRGTFGTRNMAATELRKFIDDELQFVSVYDENTILAYSTGTFKADFGVVADISARGQPIAGCLERNQLPHCLTVKLSPDCLACENGKPSSIS